MRKWGAHTINAYFKMKSYVRNKMTRTTIRVNNTTIGKTIEEKLRLIKNNKDKVDAIRPMLFTRKRDGVPPEYDIRTSAREMGAYAADLIATKHNGKLSEDWAAEAEKNRKIEEGETGKTESTDAAE